LSKICLRRKRKKKTLTLTLTYLPTTQDVNWISTECKLSPSLP
jgi:hypothetical protein